MDDAFERADDAHAREPARRAPHWEILVVACFVLAAACLLDVLPDQHVALRGFSNLPMPNTCRSRAWFGVKCPGCGLTRSIIYLAHADWRASLRIHRLGWLMAGLIAFQVPYRVMALWRGTALRYSQRTAVRLSYALVAVFVGNWLYDVIQGQWLVE